MKKLLCKLFGHRYLAISVNMPPSDTYVQSIIGWFHCMRCGHDESFQYDL